MDLYNDVRNLNNNDSRSKEESNILRVLREDSVTKASNKNEDKIKTREMKEVEKSKASSPASMEHKDMAQQISDTKI